MKIKMCHGPHSTLMTPEMGDQQFCAYSHCRGECGYPALFLRDYIDSSTPKSSMDAGGRHYVDYKAHGSMVACGPVWQPKAWDGVRFYLKRDEAEVKRLIRENWWP